MKKICGGCRNEKNEHRKGCKYRPEKKTLFVRFSDEKIDENKEPSIPTQNSQKDTHISAVQNIDCASQVTSSDKTTSDIIEASISQNVKLEKVQQTPLLNSPKPLKQFEILSHFNGTKKNEIGSSTTKPTHISNQLGSSKDVNNPEAEKQEKQLADEEVVCLGKLERFENLVDDEEEDEVNSIENKLSKTSCMICNRLGHTSFECQMICKNCSEPFHNLKTCKKPANISVMLQQFVEFCMKQCCEYKPEQTFQQSHKLYEKRASKRKKHHSKKKRSSQKRSSNNETDDDSDSSFEVRPKKRKNKIKPNELTPQYPNIVPFPQTLPFAAFSGHSTSATFNPMMAYGPLLHSAYGPKLSARNMPR